jgi:hypothetical protein
MQVSKTGSIMYSVQLAQEQNRNLLHAMRQHVNGDEGGCVRKTQGILIFCNLMAEAFLRTIHPFSIVKKEQIEFFFQCRERFTSQHLTPEVIDERRAAAKEISRMKHLREPFYVQRADKKVDIIQKQAEAEDNVELKTCD